MHRTIIGWPGLRVLGVLLVVLATSGCWERLTSSGGGGSDGDSASVVEARQSVGEAAAADDPPEPVVAMDPARADTRGAAKYKCWDDNCYWVVWCGHQICDGSWSWTFPSSGSYHITWQGVKEKCAGSPAYELRVNGRPVESGRVPQYGSCGGCDGSGQFVDRGLGTHDIEKGDTVTLWVRNDFACGIEGPGAYAAHDSLRADLQ